MHNAILAIDCGDDGRCICHIAYNACENDSLFQCHIVSHSIPVSAVSSLVFQEDERSTTLYLILYSCAVECSCRHQNERQIPDKIVGIVAKGATITKGQGALKQHPYIRTPRVNHS
ncbi:hypothetical protein RB195_017402 [Necator americanus]|uniref:Uncharacterized protein n=1 Tax=Necator americanus TaxID=51031 RepID=A0ABR1C531_NECAM